MSKFSGNAAQIVSAWDKEWPEITPYWVNSEARLRLVSAIEKAIEAQLFETKEQLAVLWKCVEKISLNAPKADKSCVEPGISLLEAVKRQVSEATRQPTQDKGDE